MGFCKEVSYWAQYLRDIRDRIENYVKTYYKQMDYHVLWHLIPVMRELDSVYYTLNVLSEIFCD